MILYNLINPSDPYTFYAPDRMIAFCVVGMLGGSYGAEPIEGAGREALIPVTIFGGFDEVCRECLGVEGDEAAMAVIEAHAESVAAAFESFCCGDRDGFEGLDRVARATRNEQRRTSMNDIGRRAFAYADGLRALNEKAA